MKRIVVIIFIFLISLQVTVAQIVDDIDSSDSIKIIKEVLPKEIDIRKPILGVIWSQFDRNRIKYAPENFLVFMVFGIEINSEGRVNEVYTGASLPREFINLMKAPEKLKEAMKLLDYNFKGYENKILMYPLLMKKLSSEKNPGKDMRIIDDIIKMWPELPPNNSLPIVLLKTHYAPFSSHRN